MPRPANYQKLPFYLSKLDALLTVQPRVYVSELLPAAWPAAEKRSFLREIKETENYYILYLRETSIFKDFSEYEKASKETDIKANVSEKYNCITLSRPAGAKISIWPGEVNRIIQELKQFQDMQNVVGEP